MRTCYQGALLWCCLNTCRNNAALKVYFFEMARELGIIETVPPCYLHAMPKPIYKSPEGLALWGVPVYAKHTIVKANRVDAQFVDHKTVKKVWAVEMSFPRIDHQEKRLEEKMATVST